MGKVVNVVSSFEDADKADKADYQSLSPLERLEILLELNRRWREAEGVEATGRPARVYRIVKLP